MASNRSRIRRVLTPAFAGASERDLALTCVGVPLAVILVGLEGALVHGTQWSVPWIAAPAGASAFLIFALPSGPMSQPWPVVGGTVLSALVGVGVRVTVGHGTIACGVAIGLAILVMWVTRSLHPPGGAAAMATSSLATPAVIHAGVLYPLAPMGMNAVILVICGIVFHRFTDHAYPHRHRPPPPATQLAEDDLDAVLDELHESFDIDREDLRLIVNRIEARTLARERAGDPARTRGPH